MDFNNILSYLQNLLSNKQTMQGQQYGSNLDLQKQVLGQQGNEFTQQLNQQGSQFTQSEQDKMKQFEDQLALENLKQNQSNDLATKEFGLQSNNQGFQNTLAMQKFLESLNPSLGAKSGATAPSIIGYFGNDPVTRATY